jgi:exopolyphosphatase/guanosine-5'-triphosphate,3'-diphosphate pyrophosphatase
MRVAVIDLGTNTFNLLIAEKDGVGMRSIYNEKISVKLGRGGIGDNVILPDAINRGLTALNAHSQVINNFKAEKVIALGTSALRTSSNACDFIDAVKTKLGIDVEIVSGNREAELIYKGVAQTLDSAGGNFLILDIGGGSNEFILATKEKILWKQSFKLGMARLNAKFQPSDPIQPEEIEKMTSHFAKELVPLFEAVKDVKLDYLVGAEGAFETFYNIVRFAKKEKQSLSDSFYSKEVSLEDFSNLHEKLVKSTVEERMKMKGLEPYRVEMIVPAMVFVKYVLDNINVSKLLVSPNSMKDGAAWELLNLK